MPIYIRYVKLTARSLSLPPDITRTKVHDYGLSSTRRAGHQSDPLIALEW